MSMGLIERSKVIKEFELFIKEFHPACTSEGVELDMFREVLTLLKEQEETIRKLYRILDDTCKRVRESTEEDYVCGLCQYDGAYKTDSGDWANECPGFDSSDCFCMKNEIREMCGMELLPD